MFLGTFSDVFENFKVFLFFKVFSKPRPSRVHWRLFSEEKLPQNRFGKCLDNIRDSFGHFRNIEIFHFFQSFPYLTLQGALGTNFTETITSKQVQNMFDCFWERFLGILKNWKFFVFWSFSKFRLSRVHWAFFSEKITSKQFQNLFGHFQERFWTLLKFQIVFDCFSNFSKFRPSRVHWSIFFYQKKLPRRMLKTCLNTFGKDFCHFEKKIKFFNFSQVFPSFDPPGFTGHFFFEKKPQNKFKTCLDTFGNVFGYLEFWEVFHFFEIFRRLYPPGCTGQKISKKSHQYLFGQSWKRFWTFLKIWILFDFCGTFSSLQGALGRVFFRRNNHAKHDQTMFLGTFLENFESFEVFPLFCNFCEFRPPRVHWAKIFAEKITSKHVENMFDCFWERFFGQFEQMKFFPVFWSFSKFRPSRVHWARKNRKNYLEQVWTLFQTFFGILKLWNLFDFVDFSWVSTVHWAQRFPSKKSIKTFSGNVFGNVFGRFWKFQSFSFFKVFSKPRPSRVHWRLFSEEKLPQNRFGKCLHNIRDSFGHFRNIEIFHFFQSFPYSTLQGALGTNFTETITSKQVQNMFDCFWERFLGILKNWKFFVFWSFSKFRLSRQHRAFFLGKNHLKTISKLVWTLSGTFLDTFEISDCFRFFFEFFQVSTLQGALVTFFNQKKYLEEFWKRVWTLLGKILVILKKKWKFFHFS